MNSKQRRVLRIISFIMPVLILMFFKKAIVLGVILLSLNSYLFLFNNSRKDTNILNILSLIFLLINIISGSFTCILLTFILNTILLVIDLKDNKNVFKKTGEAEKIISDILFVLFIIYVIIYSINYYFL